MKKQKRLAAYAVALFASIGSLHALEYSPANVSASLALKTPGNPATDYALTLHEVEGSTYNYQWTSDCPLPVRIFQKVEGDDTTRRITLMITAEEDVYFHFGQQIATGATHADCQFYLPGFWYRRNLRSPENAPSFRVADSWEVREDRLSTPLSAIFDDKNDKVYAVARLLDAPADALTTHREGEVILSGNTSVGFTGFVNCEGEATLSFGFPYRETPKSYIRKLTLGEAVEAFQHLKKGESRNVTIKLRKDQLRYWDEAKGCFIYPSGEYTIMVGASSADIRLQGVAILSNNHTAAK